MNENTETPIIKRNIWMRGLFMLLMTMVLHVSGTVLFIISFIQFVIVLLNDLPNTRLISFGRSLARYIQQTANYLAFATEEMPFPFKDWPTDD